MFKKKCTKCTKWQECWTDWSNNADKSGVGRDKHSNFQTSVGQTFRASTSSCQSVIHFSRQLFISSSYRSCHLIHWNLINEQNMYWHWIISYKIPWFCQIKNCSKKRKKNVRFLRHKIEKGHISWCSKTVFDDPEGKNFRYMLWLPIRETVCYEIEKVLRAV